MWNIIYQVFYKFVVPKEILTEIQIKFESNSNLAVRIKFKKKYIFLLLIYSNSMYISSSTSWIVYMCIYKYGCRDNRYVE